MEGNIGGRRRRKCADLKVDLESAGFLFSCGISLLYSVYIDTPYRTMHEGYFVI